MKKPYRCERVIMNRLHRVFVFFLVSLFPFHLVESNLLGQDCQEAIQYYNRASGIQDLAERERLYRQALKVSCFDKSVLAKIHNNLADTYEKQGHLEMALAEYQKACKADPLLPTPYLSLGDIYTKLKRPEDAKRFYEKGFLARNYKSTNDILESLSPERSIRVQPKITLYFGFAQADLSQEAERQLEALAGALNYEELLPYRFRLEGHTCSLGTRRYNQALSERRAKAVRDWLAAHGIYQDRLMIAGFGEDRPVADNSTEQNRRRNRRVKVRTVGVGVGTARDASSLEERKAFQLLREGESLLIQEQYEGAIELFRMALAAFEKEKSIEGIKAALRDLTLTYRFLGNWEMAEHCRDRRQQ